MTVPILNAAKRVYTRPGKGLWFGLQGEMGGTVFAHPDSYTKIAHKVKSEWKSPATLKTGVLLNHGCVVVVVVCGRGVCGSGWAGAVRIDDGALSSLWRACWRRETCLALLAAAVF